MKVLYLFCFIGLLCSCSATIPDEKINGVSFVASPVAIDSSHVQPVVNIKANYAAIMPFGFIRNLEHPEIIFNTDRQWFGETSKGVKQYVDELREETIQIMLKPQIWVWRGEFTGNIKMTSEADWKILEESYTKFIMEYAALAQDIKAEIFCIGTELEQFVANRPDYWKDLIKDIRNVYKGKLTYAANWDEFKRTPFWEQLDFIGIDAYFPVSKMKTPTIEDAMKGWTPHKTTIKTISEEVDKKVLFTEFGYRSVDFSGREPWRSDRDLTGVNMQAQVNLTQALFDTFWKENWFAGGFIWKWFHHHQKVGGLENTQFTPQNKPVETVISSMFSKF